MMRPVILSSPENTARPFAIFCVGISVMIVSSGLGAVSAGVGGGGFAGCGVHRVPSTGGGAWPGAAGGAFVAPAGGGKGCLWTPEGERAAGNAGPDSCPGNRTGGGCAGNAPLGISAGGGGGGGAEGGLGRARPRRERSAERGQKGGDTEHGTLRAIEFRRVIASRRLTCRMRRIQGSVTPWGLDPGYL